MEMQTFTSLKFTSMAQVVSSAFVVQPRTVAYFRVADSTRAQVFLE